MSGMLESCDGWVTLGNPRAFHLEQVTVGYGRLDTPRSKCKNILRFFNVR